MQNNKPECLLDYIRLSSDLLEKNNISDARLNAELMLCSILNCDRIRLYLDFEKPLSNEETSKLREYLKRRLKHEPLQYILGSTEFYGIEFKLKRGVLIPRPETELLVEKLLEDIYKSGKEKVSIFEIGSGSGCISVSVYKNLIEKKIFPEIFSIDISDEAISVSIENQKNVIPESGSLKFYKKDLFEISKLRKGFDYIVSNPPYISAGEFDKLDPEVREYEPSAALTDGEKGLKFFDKIFSISSGEIFRGKIFCEIGFGQKDSIEEIIKKYGVFRYKFHKDYNNIYRIIEAEK